MWKRREAEPAAARRGDVRRGRSRGIALVIVLWGLVLLAVIAAAFTAETRTGVALARNLVENAKARALADAGVYRAILGLLAPDVEQRWFADVPFYTLASDAGEVRIAIQDEVGKIDLNRAQDELLQSLFRSVGVEEQRAAALTDAIADFRDPDNLRHPNGAEDGDYRAAGLAWEAKDRPFEAVEELQQVLGMTPDLFARVAPALTVYSRRPGIHPLYAPREALLALPGVSPGEVYAFLTARSEARPGAAHPPDEEEEPEGAHPVQKETIIHEEETIVHEDKQSPLQALPKEFDVSRFYTLGPSRLFYSVRAEARTQNGAVFAREAIVRLTCNPEQPLTCNPEQPFVFYAWKTWKAGDIR